MTVHTIPVPEGWSVEQAWDTIARDGRGLDDAAVGRLAMKL